MKNLQHFRIALVFILVTLPLAAQTNCIKTENGSSEVEMIASKICLSLDINFGYDNGGEKIEDIFLYHLGITRDTPNYKQQILEFWNTYSNCFVCELESSKKTELPYPTHFLKRVVDFGLMTEIFDEFLLEDSEEFPIDVNAIEIVDGKGETLLDYLDKIIANPNRHQDVDDIDNWLRVIKELRDYLIEDYGAKTAEELLVDKN
ncbi:hypothetical protein [Tamlana flava]|uniref:hypothetical protein n=1 Tax=Tamlana flava TaxID=3158572 RepID=UPI00351B1098